MTPTPWRSLFYRGPGAPNGGDTPEALSAGRSRAGRELLERAHEAHTVRPGVAIVDLLKLTNAIAIATEQEPDGAAQADRLSPSPSTACAPEAEMGEQVCRGPVPSRSLRP